MTIEWLVFDIISGVGFAGFTHNLLLLFSRSQMVPVAIARIVASKEDAEC